MARQPQKRMYRTMQGRMVDIEKLRMSNESVPAIGNMNVNARGDVLGPGGKVITSKEKVMKEYYQTPKGKASDAVIQTPKTKVNDTKKQQTVTVKKIEPQTQNVETAAPKKTISTFKPKVKPQPKAEETKPVEKSGIDAALDGLE